jgi:recombination protein RecR
MKGLDALTKKFSEFPGIGKRQAKRMVYALLRKNPSYAQELAQEIKNLHQDIRLCTESYQYFYADQPDESRAPIARDMSRNRSLLMIIEKDTDIEPVENSGAYNGNYFVLGGLIPALDTKFNPVREQELLKEIERRAQIDHLHEIIFGLSLTPESEHTRIMLTQKIQPFQKKYEFQISQLGRGLSTGTELEYSDGDTLMHALRTRS